MTEFGKMAKELPLQQWKTYLRWHLIRGMAPYLSKAFVEENFAFYRKTLSGTKALSPRWKRVLNTADGTIGEAVGRLYVEKHFSPTAKAKMLEMIANLQAALADRIKALDWMSEATKQKALTKLKAFGVKVGYPDTWRDWSGLKIDRGSYVANILRANVFESRRQMARIGKPIDRMQWDVNPHMVNAFYSPNMNEICFPAGILLPPFFDPEADDACNYGAIGMAIGHEMTHGFDDQGCQYDEAGNLKNWWTEADTKAFESRQAIVVKQFDEYKPFPDLAVNGKLTLGENIADLGGLKIAFEALKKQWAKHGKPGLVDGFTPEQRFFLGYGQVWRSLSSDEYLRVQIATDPHTPARWRVIGPLSNMPEFFEAFDCGDGSVMKRPADQRPTIW
jgi:putative endopeptidase